MGKPAARICDIHDCPLTAPVSHVGGPITGPGAITVIIGNQPAAVAGDLCTCIGAVDTIITGSASVLIEGRPAARQHDRCAHGGTITTGCATVLIGDSPPFEIDIGASIIPAPIFYEKKSDTKKKPFRKPPPARRKKLINQAITDAAELLERKLKLLKKRDPTTMKQFKNWFGRTDEKAQSIILKRIRKELTLLKSMNEKHFIDIRDKDDRQITFAMVNPDDWSHTIRLGDPFWKAGPTGHDSKAGVLIHEISHFRDVGGTIDEDYGEEDCLILAESDPEKALFNADSFEYFIEV